MRLQLQPAYLLHRRPYRDSSDLAEVFTLEHGRLGAVVRGLGRRRPGGPLATVLQPFRPLLLSMSGRGDLLTLTAAETGGSPGELRGEALFSGFYLNELLLRALQRHDPQRHLFLAYAEALAGLAAAGERRETGLILRRFEFALLDDLGYAADYRNPTGSTGPLEAGAFYRVVPGEGFLPASDDAADPLRFSGHDLLAIAEGRLEAVAAEVLRRLTRLLLAEHLGSEPLRSAAVYRAVVEGSARAADPR
jgi:DNA repair protein RecO (recombination protein O)